MYSMTRMGKSATNPRIWEGGLLRIGQLVKVAEESGRVVEEARGAGGVDGGVIPCGDHFAMLVLGGVPVGRDVVRRSAENGEGG